MAVPTDADDAVANKQLVMKAMTELFIERDGGAVARYWGTPYIQHNPGIDNGSEELPGMIASMPSNFKYEPGMIVSEGDKVMLHGRYTGYGPNTLIAVDIFRVKGGRSSNIGTCFRKKFPPARRRAAIPCSNRPDATR